CVRPARGDDITISIGKKLGGASVRLDESRHFSWNEWPDASEMLAQGVFEVSRSDLQTSDPSGSAIREGAPIIPASLSRQPSRTIHCTVPHVRLELTSGKYCTTEVINLEP